MPKFDRTSLVCQETWRVCYLAVALVGASPKLAYIFIVQSRIFTHPNRSVVVKLNTFIIGFGKDPEAFGDSPKSSREQFSEK